MTKSVSTPEQLSQTRKPSKLQLQVPEHAGGPVRLATPPRVLINGESDRSANTHTHTQAPPERRSSADFFSTLDAGSEADGSGGAGGEDDEDEVSGANGGGDGDGGGVDWKRRAMVLKRRLVEKEDELRALKRRVLEAVM